MDGITRNAAAAIILCLFFVAGLLRLNDVSIYSPDSALYLIWGNAVAHGNGFVDNTKPEPDRYVLNAPLYAVLLAPAEWIAPLSLTAAKVWTLLLACAALALFYAWMKKLLGPATAIAGLLLLAFNPMIMVFSTEVLSELPFLFFLLLFFLLVEHAAGQGVSSSGGFSYFALLVCAGAVVLLREVGVALALAAAIAFLLQKNKKAAIGVAVAGAVLFALWYVRNQILVGVPPGGRPGNAALIFQHFLTDPSESIFRELLLRSQQNLKTYAFQFGGALFYPVFSNAQLNLVVSPSWLMRLAAHLFDVAIYFFILVASILMAIGLVADLRATRTGLFRLFFILLLLGLVAIYPVYDVRFLVPLLPFMIYYFLGGIRWILDGVIRRGWNDRALIVLAAVLLLPNLAAMGDILYTNILFRFNPDKFYSGHESLPVVFTWPISQMGEWIDQHTDPHALIAAPVKDIARVAKGRKVFELEPNIAEPLFESALRDNNVQYLLASVRWGNLRTYEFLMQESKRFAFTYLYSAGTLHLYKVTSRLENDIDEPDLFALHADTVTASGLVRTARAEIRRGLLDSALIHLQKAHALEPNMEEPVYQSIVASVLAEDSTGARSAYRRLLALPQTLGQSLLASQLLHGLELQIAARNSPSDTKALELLDASLTFWNNGYYNHGRAVLDSALSASPEFFAGLLWGFHYNFQMGDTAKAMDYLRRLQHIDTTNAVVRAFTVLVRSSDSLGSANGPAVKARLHLAMAAQYRIVDLPEPALDEAGRALHEDQQYVPAMIFIAEMLEAKSHLPAASAWYHRAATAQPRNSLAVSRAREIDSLMANGLYTWKRP